MKKTLAILVTVAMVFTLVAAVPGASAAVTTKTWTLYDELLKSVKNFGEPAEAGGSVTGTPDYSSSVFTVRASSYLNGGLSDLVNDDERRVISYTPSTGALAFSDMRAAGQADTWRGTLWLDKATGCHISQESGAQTFQIVFTAPTSGTYSIKPAATGKVGESAYTTYEYSNFRIETEKKLVAEYPLIKNQSNGFAGSDKSVTLKTGEKIIFTVRPADCTAEHEPGGNVYGNPKGINTYFNFVVNLESAKKSDTVYNTVLNPKDYLSKMLPQSALAYTPGVGKAEEETAVVPGDGKLYVRGTTAAQSDLFAIDFKNPWNGLTFDSYAYGANGTLYAYYVDNPQNVGKYAMTIAPDGTITTVTQGASVEWRIAFTAPKSGTYMMNIGTVTAASTTNQDAALWVYKDSAGAFKSSAEGLLLNVDFYANKTSSLNPCADGYIPVTLAAGEKVYFQTVLNKNGNVNGSWGNNNGITYSLSMLIDEAQITIKNNDEITLDKDILTASGKLTATGVSGATNAKEIYWRSTDNTVATVDATGYVSLTGKTGHCYIIAYNAFTEAKCLVNADGSTVATGVTANEDELVFDSFGKYELVKDGSGNVTGAAFYKINLNDYVTLTPAGSVPKNLTFECDDTDVLTILDSGEIVIRGEDTTEITVYLDGEEMDTFDVTIEEHECSDEKADLIYKNTPATCEADGADTWICPVCGKVSITEPITSPGHQWSEWTATTPAGAGTAGEESRTCSVCTKTETRPLAAGIVKEITVAKNPSKAVYGKGDTFDPAGMELAVTFTNYEHTQTITDFSGYTFTYDFSTENFESPVTFTVGGKTVTVNVAVVTRSGIVGDADKSGKVDNDDYIAVMEYIMGYNPTIGLYNADANGDGALDILDAITILNMIAE